MKTSSPRRYGATEKFFRFSFNRFAFSVDLRSVVKIFVTGRRFES